MAAIIVMGPLIVLLGVVLALSWPDIEAGPLLAVFLPAAIVLPVLLYPVHLDPGELDDVVDTGLDSGPENDDGA
mgnify:CR=1 FL=1